MKLSLDFPERHQPFSLWPTAHFFRHGPSRAIQEAHFSSLVVDRVCGCWVRPKTMVRDRSLPASKFFNTEEERGPQGRRWAREPTPWRPSEHRRVAGHRACTFNAAVVSGRYRMKVLSHEASWSARPEPAYQGRNLLGWRTSSQIIAKRRHSVPLAAFSMVMERPTANTTTAYFFSMALLGSPWFSFFLRDKNTHACQRSNVPGS